MTIECWGHVRTPILTLPLMFISFDSKPTWLVSQYVPVLCVSAITNNINFWHTFQGAAILSIRNLKNVLIQTLRRCKHSFEHKNNFIVIALHVKLLKCGVNQECLKRKEVPQG